MKAQMLVVAVLGILLQAECPAQHPLAKVQADKASSLSAARVQDSEAKVDPAKEAAIRQLIFQSGFEITMNQMIDDMGKGLKPVLVNSLPAGEYRDRFADLWWEKFRSKIGTQILELAVPVYDKYLSMEEIKGLIQFYGTPLGQKALRLSPLLTGVLQEKGEKLGELMGQEAGAEVLYEHPDLKKALEEAEKRSEQPR